MNLQAYAAHRKAQGLRGHSHVAVLKAIESGRLTEPAAVKVGGRWVIDPALADAQWADNTDPGPVEQLPPVQAKPAASSSQPKPAAKRKSSAKPAAVIESPPRQPEAPSIAGPSLAEARRAKAVYQAERERLAVMKEKGELVLVQDIRQEASRLARQVRDLLLIIPSRNAAKVASMQDAEAIRALLQAEIESALRGLAHA
jgi:hypothetical protein